MSSGVKTEKPFLAFSIENILKDSKKSTSADLPTTRVADATESVYVNGSQENCIGLKLQQSYNKSATTMVSSRDVNNQGVLDLSKHVVSQSPPAALNYADRIQTSLPVRKRRYPTEDYNTENTANIRSSTPCSSVSEDSFESTPVTRRKKQRTAFCTEQIMILESSFQTHHYLSEAERHALATKLNLKEQQIRTWFQNRRMKEKRKETGSHMPRTSPSSLPTSLPASRLGAPSGGYVSPPLRSHSGPAASLPVSPVFSKGVSPLALPGGHFMPSFPLNMNHYMQQFSGFPAGQVLFA